MTESCDVCGNVVSNDYYRVMSAEDGNLYGCQECENLNGRKHPDVVDGEVEDDTVSL